ncbi:MAG TPA: cytochrome c oxidase assembly protein [Archangium sp.]
MPGALRGVAALTAVPLSGLLVAQTPRWSFDAFLLAALLLGGVLYARGAWVSWTSKDVVRALKPWQVSAYAAGWLTACVALVSPLERLAAERVSAHVAQDVVLFFVAAPLLALGRPLLPFLWALPRELRKGVQAKLRARGAVRTWRVLTHPLVAVTAPALTLWLWHLPGTGLKTGPVRALELVSSFIAAVLFFRAVAPGRARRLSPGLAALLVLATTVHTSLLGVLLTFLERPWFATTALDPLLDQRLAGMILWLLAGLVLSGVGLAHLGAWLDGAETRTRRSTVELLTRPRRTTTRTQP